MRSYRQYAAGARRPRAGGANHRAARLPSGNAGRVDDHDWVTVVAGERCGQCGLMASTLGTEELGGLFAGEGKAWARLLTGTDSAVLRRRRTPEVWSALEYGAHARDVLVVFTDRIGLTLSRDEPTFGWWDHEAAVVDERYNEQDPAAVAAAVEAAAVAMGATLAAVEGPAWTRTGTRRDGETFTVAGLARFALHEVHHHRIDAEASVTA